VNHKLNIPFNRLIKEVNQTGKGVVQIKIIGGPEATPVQEQLGALQKRIVDIYFGPTSYFVGDIPETKAMNASNRSAMELRANGGLTMLNKAFNKRANAQFLGYFGSGYTFHIYMTMDPKRTATGGIDWKGLKIRGAAPYRPFYDRMGITMINLHLPEMYTAFERGVVDGFGWLTIAVTTNGWEKFIKHRVSPPFWQGDFANLVNLDVWKGLSPQARDLLNNLTIKHERETHNYFKSLATAEEKKMRAAGMKDIHLKGAEKREFVSAAYGGLWESLGKHVPASEVAAFKAKFWKE
jgi:TRAP-type C4-dicarboxylate transport system substrate-binding protein